MIEAATLSFPDYSFLLTPALTSLSFGTPTLVTDVAGLIGDTRRYTNVTTGVDALVSITATNGANTALANIDGSSTGRLNAFQPEITGHPNQSGSISFQVQFVSSGTSIPTTVTNIVANGIDVDGGGETVVETAAWQNTDAAFLDAGTQLTQTAPSPNAAFRGTTTGFAGVDVEQTVANYSVFFSSPVTSLNFTLGMTGTGNTNTTRLNSVSFEAVDLHAYNAPLAAPDYAPTTSGTPVTFSILDNDWGGEQGLNGGRDQTPINAATVYLDPAVGGIQATTAVAGGSFTYNGDGTVTFTPTAGFTGDTAVSYTVQNTVTATNPVVETSNASTLNVTVLAQNAPPVPIVANTITAEDTPVALTGISFSDLDAGTANVQVTLSVSGGSLNLSTSVAGGLTAAQFTGNDTDTITITAPLAAINATLADAAGLVFTAAANDFDDQTLTGTINDLGNFGGGGPNIVSSTSTILVTSVNDAPTNTLP